MVNVEIYIRKTFAVIPKDWCGRCPTTYATNGGLCWADEAYFIKLNRTSAVTDYRITNGRVVNIVCA